MDFLRRVTDNFTEPINKRLISFKELITSKFNGQEGHHHIKGGKLKRTRKKRKYKKSKKYNKKKSVRRR